MTDAIEEHRRETERRVREGGDYLLQVSPRLGFRAYENAAQNLGCEFEIIEVSGLGCPADFVLGRRR